MFQNSPIRTKIEEKTLTYDNTLHISTGILEAKSVQDTCNKKRNEIRISKLYAN